ncbi:hypothetical protein SDC9_102409 [bioreactor metagenome]|uniref:Uncharacterized protein n=1 Tax=bioreactor metagenome TaxID=1076179 RepID=A0A645AQS0_9ZZZZ
MASQGATVCVHQVGPADQEGISTQCSAHAAYHGDAPLIGCLEQGTLGIEGVDGINHQVYRAFQNGIHSPCLDEQGERLNGTSGIDCPYPVLCHLCLELAQGVIGGQDLSVEVGDAHRIEVDKPEVANTASDKRLETHAPDSSQTHNHHMFLVECLDLLVTEQATDS